MSSALIVYKFGYPAGHGTSDISPFVVKLETWLRLSGIPYEGRTGGRSVMPKAKLPVAEIDGRLIPDSSAIVAHLQTHDPRALRDEHLSAAQQAHSLAIQALLEDRLYWVSFYLRWCVPANVQRYKPLLMDYALRAVPGWQRPLVKAMATPIMSGLARSMRQQAWQQGVGRHGLDEVLAQGQQGWQALSTLLGEQSYLFGDQPSSVDATLFAWVHTLTRHPFPSPLQDFVKAQPNLMAHHDRIWARHWV